MAVIHESDLLLRNPSGAASPKLYLGNEATPDSYIIETTDDNWDFYIAGGVAMALKNTGIHTPLAVYTDTISEYNASGNGVTIDGLQIKDQIINFPSSNLTIQYNGSTRFKYDETYDSIHLGESAAASNTALHTIAIGNFALDNVTSSPQNLAIGTSALYNQTDNATGANLAIGSYALVGTAAGGCGYRNVSIGSYANRYCTGFGNIGIGSLAGQGDNGTSDYNYTTLIGYGAGIDLTTGDYNIFIGAFSGYVMTTSQGNIGIGYGTYRFQTGSQNMAIGYSSFFGVSGQSNNANYSTFLGYESGYYNVSGDNNMFIGYQAGKGHSTNYLTGGNNIGIGRAAGTTISTATFNLMIGNYAGDALTSGGVNLLIGHYVDTDAATDSYKFRLGYSTTYLLEGNLDSGNEFLASPYEFRVDDIDENTSSHGTQIHSNVGIGITPSASYKLYVQDTGIVTTSEYAGTGAAWSDYPGSTIPAITTLFLTNSSAAAAVDGYNTFRLHARNNAGHNAYTILATQASNVGNHETNFHIMLREGGGVFNTVSTYSTFASINYYDWKHEEATADIRHRFIRNATTEYVLGIDNTNGFQIHSSTTFDAANPDFCIMPTNNTVNIGGIEDDANYKFVVTGGYAKLTNPGHSILDIVAQSDTSTYDSLLRFWSGATPALNAIIGWDNGQDVLAIDYGSSFQATHDIAISDTFLTTNISVDVSNTGGAALMYVTAKNASTSYDAYIAFRHGSSPANKGWVGWDAGESIMGLSYGTKNTTPDIEINATNIIMNKPVFLEKNINFQMPAADHGYSGETVEGLCGETISIGQAVCLNSSGSWIRADADTGSAKYPARGIVAVGGDSTDPCIILIKGILRDDTWTWTTGQYNDTLYLSQTLGSITVTAPTAANSIVQPVAWIINDDHIFVDVSATWWENE